MTDVTDSQATASSAQTTDDNPVGHDASPGAEPQADVSPAAAEATPTAETHPSAEAQASPDGDEGEGDEPEKLVPVTEAIRYRKRAQQAEQQLESMQQKLQSLQSKLDEAEQTIHHLERRQKIDETLAASDPIDTEAVRLLTEQTIQQMDEPDVQAAVEELRQRRPYLFHQQSGASGSAMAARVADQPAHEPEQAAEHAAMSGDRRDLLRYLRLRRNRP